MATPHVHVELIKKLADDTSLTIWLWSPNREKWVQATFADVCNFPGYVFALGDKPTAPPRKMCELAGVKFPMPETVAPKYGTDYWSVDENMERTATICTWVDSNHDFERLKARRVHLNPDAAVAHFRALEAATKWAMEEAR